MGIWWAAALLSTVAAADEAALEDLFQLIPSNYDRFRTEHPAALIFASEMRCYSCPDVRDFLVLLQPSLKERKVVAAELDLHSEKKIAHKLGLKHAPAIAFAKGEEAVPYGGPLLAATLLAWLDQLLAASSKPLAEKEELEAFRRLGTAVVYHLPPDAAAALAVFDALVRENADVHWGHSTAEFLKKDDKIDADFALAFSAPKFAGLRRLQSPKAFTAAEISAFVAEASAETVSELTVALSRRIVSGAQTAAIFLSHAEDEQAAADFTAVAREFSPKLVFAAGTGTILRQFRDIPAPAPGENAVMILAMGSGRIDRFFCALGRAELRECVSAFLGGTLPPYLRSEPEPKGAAGAVRKVVGKTFARDVLEADKSVLLAVVEPHNKDCADLEPVFGALAEELQSSALEFAELNSAANEVPGLRSGGLPALYLFLRGKKKQPLLYRGALSPAALRAYLSAEVGH